MRPLAYLREAFTFYRDTLRQAWGVYRTSATYTKEHHQ